MQGDQLPPVVRYVRSLGHYYLREEVAKALGLTESRLEWIARNDPALGPTIRAPWASGDVWLYTERDVAELTEWIAANNVTNPPNQLWTIDEYKDRQRRERMARYYRSRVKVLEDAGHPGRAAAARRKAQKLVDQLQAEREKRMKRKKATGAGRSR